MPFPLQRPDQQERIFAQFGARIFLEPGLKRRLQEQFGVRLRRKDFLAFQAEAGTGNGPVPGTRGLPPGMADAILRARGLQQALALGAISAAGSVPPPKVPKARKVPGRTTDERIARRLGRARRRGAARAGRGLTNLGGSIGDAGAAERPSLLGSG